VIGITASLKEDTEAVAQCPLGRFVRADLHYVEAVTEAGGVPVVLPPVVGPQAAKALLEGLDGLLLSGGSDLDPGYYGERPIPELDVTIPERDAFEMALLQLALRRRVPVFGICRGMQIMNVALGGTLYQDLPSQLGSAVLKHQQDTPNWQPTHEVEVDEDSWVGGIIGACVKVNSYHHQGVKDLAGGLIASARSSDGVMEAVESRDFSERWLVGVQWHPERMRDAAAEHRGLFEAHASAAECHALRRAAV
jgi:putative glutamine amidotransferase